MTVRQLYVKLLDKFPENILNRQYIHEIIRDNNITRKRATFIHFPKTFRGEPRDHMKELDTFFNAIKNYNLNDIISIDETAIRPGMSFNYCRSSLGRMCTIKTDSNEIFRKYSLIVAISNNKCLGYHIYDQGAVNADRFEEFIGSVANRYSNKLFILDNAQIHKRPRVKEILRNTGNNVVYTLPYSPRLNPIEQFFNQLKHYMKLEKAMTLQTLKESVKNAIGNIRPEHYKNYFKYAYDKENYVNKPDNPDNRKRSNKYKQPKIYRP
jgi:transposase